jgi:hypothetical protein
MRQSRRVPFSFPQISDDASIADFNARWAWTVNRLLPAWQVWDINNWAIGFDVKRLLNGGY